MPPAGRRTPHARDQQRLRQQRLRRWACSATPFVRTPRRDATEAARNEHGPEPTVRSRPRLFQLVRRCGQLSPQHGRDAAERPQRALHPGDQRRNVSPKATATHVQPRIAGRTRTADAAAARPRSSRPSAWVKSIALPRVPARRLARKRPPALAHASPRQSRNRRCRVRAPPHETDRDDGYPGAIPRDGPGTERVTRAAYRARSIASALEDARVVRRQSKYQRSSSAVDTATVSRLPAGRRSIQPATSQMTPRAGDRPSWKRRQSAACRWRNGNHGHIAGDVECGDNAHGTPWLPDVSPWAHSGILRTKT
jgi:hypothetical protein